MVRQCVEMLILEPGKRLLQTGDREIQFVRLTVQEGLGIGRDLFAALDVLIEIQRH